MTTTVKRRLFPVKSSSAANTAELSAAIRGCPVPHAPIAALRLAVVWPRDPQRHGSRHLRGKRAAAVLALTAVLLFAVGTFIGTIYISGLLMQQLQGLQQHYNEPRAQYSDVWNWQRRR